MIQPLTLPLTRGPWANYFSEFQMPHPQNRNKNSSSFSPSPDHMPRLALSVSGWGILKDLSIAQHGHGPQRVSRNVGPCPPHHHFPHQRAFSGGRRVFPPHLRGLDALVGGLHPRDWEGQNKPTPSPCQDSEPPLHSTDPRTKSQ